MELREFVAQALAETIQGVLDAQTALGTNGKFVNPQLSTSQGVLQQQGRMLSNQGQIVQTVEFDVAVTASSATGTKGGIGVVAGVFALGSQGQSSAESVAVSRLKFSVPVALPYGDKTPAP